MISMSFFGINRYSNQQRIKSGTILIRSILQVFAKYSETVIKKLCSSKRLTIFIKPQSNESILCDRKKHLSSLDEPYDISMKCISSNLIIHSLVKTCIHILGGGQSQLIILYLSIILVNIYQKDISAILNESATFCRIQTNVIQRHILRFYY